MTEERLRFIERCCVPNRGSRRRGLILELLKEVKRARQSEKICRSAAMIYKQDSEPVILRRYA